MAPIACSARQSWLPCTRILALIPTERWTFALSIAWKNRRNLPRFCSCPRLSHLYAVDSSTSAMTHASRKVETAEMSRQICSCTSSVSLDLRPGGRGFCCGG